MPPRSKQSSDDHPFPMGCWFVPLLFVLMMIASSVWQSKTSVYRDTFLSQYDAFYYHNLRENLVQGNGYELDFSEANIGASLESLPAFQGSRLNWIYSMDVDGPTTNHFPAVPILMEAGHLLTSGPWSGMVSFGTLLLALALALLVNQIRSMFGFLPATIAAVTIFADVFLQQSPTLVTCDAWITALVIMSFVVFLQAVSPTQTPTHTSLATPPRSQLPRSIWKWPMAGLLLGVSMLFRPSTSLWLAILLPCFVGFVVVMLVRKKLPARIGESFLLFSIGLLIVISPWWIRNCKVAGDFKPLGNEMQQKIIGAYVFGGPTQGNLNVESIILSKEKLLMEQTEWTDPIDKETFVATTHQERTQDWIKANPNAATGLMLNRVMNHFGITSQDPKYLERINLVLAIGALLGCVLTWRRFGFVVISLIAASTLVTALTWSDYGRFSLPIRPLLHAAFALGLTQWIPRKQRRKNQSAETGEEPL